VSVVPPTPRASGSDAGRLTSRRGPLSLTAPESPEAATNVMSWSRTVRRVSCIAPPRWR
jgi:hypothetical protein